MAQILVFLSEHLLKKAKIINKNFPLNMYFLQKFTFFYLALFSDTLISQKCQNIYNLGVFSFPKLYFLAFCRICRTKQPWITKQLNDYLRCKLTLPLNFSSSILGNSTDELHPTLFYVVTLTSYMLPLGFFVRAPNYFLGEIRRIWANSWWC